MNELKLTPIGRIVNKENEVMIKVNPEYREGLLGLKDFSHLMLLSWMDGCDNEKDRSTLTEEKPYKEGPERLGVFAMRSPKRPNPIAVTNLTISHVDEEKGEIGLYYCDAFDGTPVLDIKPYTPGIDRVNSFTAPYWCRHWPSDAEGSASFDWQAVFNF